MTAYRTIHEAAAAMLAVVDRAYPDRIAEGIAYQVDLCRQVDPELFVSIDVELYRLEVERQLRAAELGDLWRLEDLLSGVAASTPKEAGDAHK